MSEDRVEDPSESYMGDLEDLWAEPELEDREEDPEE